MRKTRHPPGTLKRLVIDSEVLRGNLLGDPTDRQLLALGGYGVFCLLVEIVRRRK